MEGMGMRGMKECCREGKGAAAKEKKADGAYVMNVMAGCMGETQAGNIS